MSTLRSASVSIIASAIALSACSIHHEKTEEPAMAAGASAIAETGRDPFGSERAATVATGDDKDDDSGVPCGNFSLTIVGPFVQVIEEQTTFSGHAMDDQKHEFKLNWSASSGELSETTGQQTTFICHEPGVHTISMTATLAAVCSSALAHVVTCLEPND
jgi:hypothetical protein